ncbi:MAG: Fe-only nitrogenase accessory protein AnfO [Rhodospirillaceae bacterium]|nr:Fe-only nitrogenase accessory protein AnfO [Rhodospirillaceae bacterium]
MTIAVYVDNEGKIASPYGEGCIRLYGKESETWLPAGDIALSIRPDMTLGGVKAAVRDAASRMGEGAVFLSSGTRGLVYTILQEEFGIHVWAGQGPIPDQIEAILIQEAERARNAQPSAASSCGSGCAPGRCGPRTDGPFSACGPASPGILPLERIGQGYWRIDLDRTLKQDTTLNSRMILIPILEERAFDTLEILCNHLPRWFAQTLDALNLRADYDISGQGLKVLVSPNR